MSRALLLTFATFATLASFAGCKASSPAVTLDQLPQTDAVTSSVLTAPVDVVRDEWGIPHIYGQTFADVAFAEGYVMASDRLSQMDLARHKAEGTLAEIGGDLAPSLLDGDIAMRAHHLKKTAADAFAELKASSDPSDQAIVQALTSFAAGVTAFISDVQAGKRTVPLAVKSAYDPATTQPWTEVDSIALSYLQAFELAFDADTEITYSAIDAAEATVFDGAADPTLAARKGLAKDLEIFAPIDPTYTLEGGWTGMHGDTSTASAGARSGKKKLLALMNADRKTVRGVGNDHILYPERGSNNWIVGPALSTTGHTLVANDTHLSLDNPAIFYLVHLVVRGGATPVNAMGVQFAGIPGIVLGNNVHLAWGATVNNIDVTDVYEESIVPCDTGTGPCVAFKGGKVALVPRQEVFKSGHFGTISTTTTMTLYDVPHHGPIIPRVSASHAVEPLGTSELSIRYTGYEPAQLIRGIFGVLMAGTMKDAVSALDRDFRYGGQNWVIGDDQGNFGWTQVIRVPRRAPGNAPWKVLPGDGTAEWGSDMDPRYIPHAYNPAKGFLATANNDPIGVTDDGDPFFDEPVVDGGPLYLGYGYDPGTRVGRITKRLEAATAGGNKVSVDDLQGIQADTVSEWAPLLAPTFLDAAQALGEEIAHPGTHTGLTSIAQAASATTRALVGKAHDLVQAWSSFDTPSGLEDNATPQQIADSQATLVYNAWFTHFANAALGDELAKLGVSPGDEQVGKLLVRMCDHPDKLATGLSAGTSDPVLFDDLTTPEVESKQQIAAKALVLALDFIAGKLGNDPSAWRWGTLHTLTLSYLLPVAALQIPESGDPQFPNGFPRHGDNGTVDVGGHGLSLTDYSYSAGPAIRFVCELDPSGPHARNALPGGEQLDPHSPHYKDQLALWLKNQTFDLAFQDTDVVASAQKEIATNKDGRIHFAPR